FVTRDNLEKQGYRITHCEDGIQGLEAFGHNTFDLCLLDVMLPHMDGFTLAEKIREMDRHIPILFLTAKSMKEDKIKGLTLGGDDYITKPYSIDELILKIEVFLRRSRIVETVGEPDHQYFIGNYMLDTENFLLKRGKKETGLTYKEVELLKFLNDNRDKVLKREDILTAVWGDDSYMLSRSLDVFISRLRKYLSEDPTISIRSVHSVGFKFLVKESRD
ncbi:MAG: response regulator transcription factor, partial [Bacteroidetes bacterium]|nr:response regulator transcription factor [Bacteroidota bacterium]